MFISRLFLKKTPFLLSRGVSTTSDAPSLLTPYQKKIALFFNHIIELSPATTWHPTNLIFEENDDKLAKSFQTTQNKHLGFLFGSFAASLTVNFLISPYLTAFPMYYTMKYFSSFWTLKMMNNKIVRKMEILDKECVEVRVFNNENKEKINMNSIEIEDISKGLTIGKMVDFQGVENLYFVRFSGKDRMGKKRNFFLMMQSDREKINSPKDRVKVLKTMFIEAKGGEKK